MNKLKTVWDVVNEFKGEWSYSQQDDDEQLALYQFEYSHVFPGDEVGQIHKGHTGFNEDKYIKICTIAEFKALVMDMQLGLDVNSISYLESIHYEISNKTPLEPAVKKPLVYTQAMADNGELPSVGMKCLINFPDVDNAWYEYIIDFIGNYTLIASCKGDVERFSHINDVHLKPIDTRTTKEKALDELRDLDDSICNNIDWLADLLQAIIEGKITGVKWTGE